MQNLELVRIFRVIWENKWMLLVLSLTATVTGILATYAVPTKYESTALVLVRPNESIRYAQSAGSKEVLDFPASQNVQIDAPSKTYIEIIKSQAVVERIVDSLKIYERVDPPPEGWWEELKDKIKTPIKAWMRTIKHYAKYGREIEVSPREQEIEDVMLGLSLEAAKNTYVFEITYTTQEAQDAADVANKAAEIFLEYHSKANSVEAETARNVLQGMVAQSLLDLNEARAELKRYKERNQTFSLTEEYNTQLSVMSELETDLEKKEVELARLLQTYGPKHPDVLSAEAERKRLIKALAQRRWEVKSHPNKEKELEALQLKVKVAEDSYDFIHKQYEEARIKEAETLNEIRLVSPAVAPLYPSKPIKWYYGAGAFSVALVSGIAWVLFREYLSARLRSVADVTETLNLRVVATIPEVKGFMKI